MATDEGEEILKVVVVGDQGVGKTTLLRSLTGDNSAARSTFGVDFAVKSVELRGGRRIKAQLWDSSESRYRVEPKMYYPRAAGALVVYDIKSHATLENAERWLAEVRHHAGDSVVVMLVGNKLDERHLRSVSTDEAVTFADRRTAVRRSICDREQKCGGSFQLLYDGGSCCHRQEAPGRAKSKRRAREECIKAQEKRLRGSAMAEEVLLLLLCGA